MSEAVTYERREAVAWVTLNRPEAMNAINDAVRTGLPECLARAEQDDEVRAIVLSGNGPRAFCVGADVKEFAPVEALADYRGPRLHGHWIAAFERLRKPVIAALHGFCMGGGLEIAMACDIRIAAENAVFAMPELTHGFIPGAGGTQRLARLVGIGRAMDMILSGERIDAQEARRIGLVTRVTAAESLAEEAGKLAALIAGRAPLAVMAAKEALLRGADMELRAGMRLELDLLTFLMGSEDRKEAIAAFRDKRAPAFKGR